MANLVQLKMLENLDGYLLVDKPSGIAFSTVVKTVKRKFNLVKVGHGGSLDTQASGLMILLINDANKFVDRVMGADRRYRGTVLFGRRTDTGDVFGRPVDGSAERPVPGTEADLKALVREFSGDIFQTEPGFAAIRREGASDYEIVSTGEHQAFMAHVYRLELKAPEGDDRRSEFDMKVSKSVIPRALADGMGAVLETLRRTGIGRFEVADAVPFNRLLETEMRDFASLVLPLSQAL